MRLGRSSWHWYDIPILLLAAVIVYPDKTVDWIGERTGRAFDWRHVLLAELLAIAAMVTAMLLLMPAYPRLEWWYPLLAVGALGVVRGATWFITGLFGFHD